MTTIACDPGAIAETDRELWVDVATRVSAAVQEVNELPDGYAFRLPAEATLLATLAQHVDFERRCCPFVRFSIEVEPEHGPMWLRVTGGEGAMAFFRSALESANLLSEPLRRGLEHTA